MFRTEFWRHCLFSSFSELIWFFLLKFLQSFFSCILPLSTCFFFNFFLSLQFSLTFLQLVALSPFFVLLSGVFSPLPLQKKIQPLFARSTIFKWRWSPILQHDLVYRVQQCSIRTRKASQHALFQPQHQYLFFFWMKDRRRPGFVNFHNGVFALFDQCWLGNFVKFSSFVLRYFATLDLIYCFLQVMQGVCWWSHCQGETNWLYTWDMWTPSGGHYLAGWGVMN